MCCYRIHCNILPCQSYFIVIEVRNIEREKKNKIKSSETFQFQLLVFHLRWWSVEANSFLYVNIKYHFPRVVFLFLDHGVYSERCNLVLQKYCDKTLNTQIWGEWGHFLLKGCCWPLEVEGAGSGRCGAGGSVLIQSLSDWVDRTGPCTAPVIFRLHGLLVAFLSFYPPALFLNIVFS